MHISRYLKPDFIQLGMRCGHMDEIDEEKNYEAELWRLKTEVISELADLFDKTGIIRNKTKFSTEMLNYEKSSSSATGNGVAVLDIRSMTPKAMGLIFARSQEGVWFDATDEEPVHIFFGIACPSYDTKKAQHFYKWIAQSFLQEDWLPSALLYANDEHEIIAILSSLQ